MKNIIIAVDGFSSCGKSTLAKDIAKEIGLVYIDTGAMYRGATLLAMQHRLINGDSFDEARLLELLNATSITFGNVDNQNHLFLNDSDVEKEIRSIEVSDNVSLISKSSKIREELVNRQRTMSKSMNVILDGRDIGTVVFPFADVKLFVTASTDVRAQRRFDEMKSMGENISLSMVAENIKKRDYIDQNREVSPLKKADDAFVIDNTFLDKQEQLKHAISIIKSVRPDIFNKK